MEVKCRFKDPGKVSLSPNRGVPSIEVQLLQLQRLCENVSGTKFGVP